MKKEEPHPLDLLNERIEERGVVVIDGVTTMPTYGNPYVSPHLVVGLNRRGYVKAEYDMRLVEFFPHEISVLYPNHIVLGRESSDDYLATLVVVSSEFLQRLKHRSTFRNHLEYLRQPAFRLTDEQYETVLNMIQLMDKVSRMEVAGRTNMLESLLDVFSQLVDEYRFENEGKPSEQLTNDLLLSRFFDAVVAHHKESREVQFYADLLHLSPKYFSALIKRCTGMGAGEWIASYVIVQAKAMLNTRLDLSIQQIASELGFPDSSTFSRYFKKNTGLSPIGCRRSR